MAHMVGFEELILCVVTVKLVPSMFHSAKPTVLIYSIPLNRLPLPLSLFHLVPLLLPLLLLLPAVLFLHLYLFFAFVALISQPIIAPFVLNLNPDHYLFCRCDR
ncbi:hypothetical protein L873DRAFT_1258609 [Choiromyces venosus 120613-1]|uniref:Uncharacterized protein n=1 Tax=Choiromyces venosus 120613-1 TaxID=1336337 RepID=A0A3N4JD83_9PEZI|nr:hypothetical protein L873DRAFT_1258609 [Choiromyces venosus 120613-1]